MWDGLECTGRKDPQQGMQLLVRGLYIGHVCMLLWGAHPREGIPLVSVGALGFNGKGI